MTASTGSIPVEGIQQLTRDADQALLRDTIGILEILDAARSELGVVYPTEAPAVSG